MRPLRASCLLITAALSCGGRVVVDGAAPTGPCPAVAPHDGDPCDPPGLACELPLLCCSPTATCVAGVWNLQGPLCRAPCSPCDPEGDNCAAGGVCVVSSVGAVATYACAEDPCDGQALSCACAASLCSGGCLQASGSTVQCSSLSP